jgi:predicted nucleotidyltransferase
MTRQEISDRLTTHLAELRAMGVRSLDLFGSFARDEARPDSDVDLLIEFARPVGFFDFFKVQERLEAILGRRVDLGTKASLKPRLKDRILAEAVRVA